MRTFYYTAVKFCHRYDLSPSYIGVPKHRKSPQITANQYVWSRQMTANRCWIRRKSRRKSPQIKTT